MARKCKVCKQVFEHKGNGIKPTCGSYECQVEYATNHARKAQDKQRKDYRRETRERKARLKTRSDWLREAQVQVNAYIRTRDKDLPCISCGRHHNGKWNAGHYRSVGSSPELRFDVLNIHKQCEPCNSHLSGNIVEYRINLIARIGQEAVDYLEGPHEPKHYTIEEIQAIKAKYRAMAKEME